MKTVLGIFSERDDAEKAIDHLEKNGYSAKDISVIVKDDETVRTINEGRSENVAAGAVSGATTGGVIGGLAGLLIGIGAITIPGIGAFLIGGPLVAALGLTGAAASTVTGAATGALAGGLVGALTGLGVPEETAKIYESRIREGAILLAVPVTGRMEDMQVRDMFEKCNATQVQMVEGRNVN